MQTSPQHLRSGRRPIQTDHANLRVFLPEVRPKLRSVPVNARRAVPRMPQEPLPVAKVGTRKGQASAWHRRGSDFQGIRILHHRLSKRFVQRSCQKRVTIENSRVRREICGFEGTGQKSVACSDQDSREKLDKRVWVMN